MTISGKQTPLPITDQNDLAGAWAAFKAILDNAKAIPAGRPESVSVLVAEYLDSISHRVTPKTKRDYAGHLRWFVARYGKSCIGQIEAQAVEKSAAAETWSDSHKANVLWTIQSLIRWAGRKDFTLDRPAKESRGAETVITEAVYRKILRETKGDFYQFVRLLWVVGSRPMESGALTAEMIDWPSGTVTWREHKTKRKTGRVRILYLNSEALAVLREQVDKYTTGPLFRNALGKALTLQNVMVRMIRLSERIGHHVTAGHFRHTFATRALAAGISDVQVAALLGHTSTSMVHRHYGHLDSNAKLLRDAAEKLAG